VSQKSQSAALHLLGVADADANVATAAEPRKGNDSRASETLLVSATQSVTARNLKRGEPHGRLQGAKNLQRVSRRKPSKSVTDL
jgi:hypothetical protein